MGRITGLTDIEKGKILALKSQNWSANKISQEIHRSRHVIQNFLRHPQTYGKNKSTGRPSVLTARDRRRIIRVSSNQSISVGQVKTHLQLPQSRTTIWRALHSSGIMRYEKLKKAPRLLDRHKRDRVEWARGKMSWSVQWQQIVFSDEKKWNLDGPDGHRCYCHDLRKEPQVFSKRQFGGGSVMTWAAFGWNGKTKTVFVNGTVNSNKYQDLLQMNLLTVARVIGGRNWTFQQDNAPCHASKSTKEWFERKNIRVLDWPSLSPDLNPIENLWGTLSRRVYRNGRQFDTVEELKTAITEEWERLSIPEMQTLISSMPNRIFNVIHGNGKPLNN